MLQCSQCRSTAFVLSPPTINGRAVCAKCGRPAGRFRELTPKIQMGQPGAEQPHGESDRNPWIEQPTQVTAISGPVAIGAAETTGELQEKRFRILRRAPGDWSPLPEFVRLSSMKDALTTLERSGLVEVRLAPDASCRAVPHWRITGAGRKALSGR